MFTAVFNVLVAKKIATVFSTKSQSQTFAAVRSALKTAAEVVFNAQQAAAKQIAALKGQFFFFL